MLGKEDRIEQGGAPSGVSKPPGLDAVLAHTAPRPTKPQKEPPDPAPAAALSGNYPALYRRPIANFEHLPPAACFQLRYTA
jgi:hypothetical protein